MKKLIIVSTILLVITTNSTAQVIQEESQFQPPQVIPPSPNAASLGQYGDIPVSYYTGVPNISIPLYTIKSGNIELPIGLSYHASGIKVAQEASWVGLGWGLNSGGVITRTVMDEDDLDSYKFGFQTSSTPLPPAIQDPDYTSTDLFETSLIHNGSKDSEPDIFNYNFFGKTGKMVFPKGGTHPVLIEQNNLKFSYSINEGWVVTDANGWKYYFSAIETTRIVGRGLNEGAVLNTSYYPLRENFRDEFSEDYITTSWYLSEVINPNGDSIKFVYDTENTYRTISQQSIDETRRKSRLIRAVGPTAPFSMVQNNVTVSLPVVTDVYLKRIEYNNGYAVFNTIDRQDLRKRPEDGDSVVKNPQCLESIEFFDLNNTSLKKVNLQYSYFNAQSSRCVNSENCKRLRLDAVQESFKSGDGYVTKPSYKLNYNTQKLPEKTSFSIDYWGYFNGGENNRILHANYSDMEENASTDQVSRITGNTSNNYSYKSLVPMFIKWEGTLGSQSAAKKFLSGANRQVNPALMKAGILQSIEYPTGGTTFFTFEPHDYSNPTGRPYEVTEAETSIVLKYDYFTAQELIDRGYPMDQIIECCLTKEQQFELRARTLVKIDYNFRYENNGSHVSSLINLTLGGTIFELKPPDETPTGFKNGVFYTFLPKGVYSFKVNDQYQKRSASQLTLTVIEGKLASKNIAGGLRIKEIASTSANDIITKKETFSYEEAGLSTGKLINPLINNFSHGIRQTAVGNEGGASFHDYAIFERKGHNIVKSGVSSQGNIVGYDKVKVTKTDSTGNHTNGYSIYNFQNSPNLLPHDSYAYFHGVPAFSFPGNGQLLNEWHFGANNKLVSEKEYKYGGTSSSSFEIKGLKVVNVASFITSVGSTGNLNSWSYTINSKWMYLNEETETTYDLNGQNPVTTVTTYEYGNADHKNVTQTEQTNSEGKTLTKKYYYPPDRPTNTSMSNSVFTQMTDDNVLNPVIKEETEVNGILTSSVIRNHEVKTRNANGEVVSMYLPENIRSLKNGSSNVYETRLDFMEYDNYGNILEVSQTGGAITSYVWGYNKEYPIAKIENATYQDIAEALEISVATLKTYGEDNFSQLNQLRTSLPNAMITTYTYDPLIGITSMTDPRGYTMTYHYDDFNRLEYVKDAEGNLVSENQYNYKN
ncbi:RHS repeat domain-containing protein [Aquimarina sp. RZ0]|uniref:RHS repeat domain-containing protein n=1 Tax=Aquimarina sp. RZ0 TaxID=2607730 RepID=UPI0011F17675|nr:RHS repeat domain-containing protein [Aquimarina sp. RZ0]KAA1243239.1 RHS repeat protein [Aquimarina sp. RZ0]